MRYNIIYADPPWQYNDKANAGKRGACHKYPLMTLSDIKRLDVASIAADDCLLAMWWTAPLMREAIEVVDAWGFEFTTGFGFLWHKISKYGKEFMAMGNWTRTNPEACLFATRGRPKRINYAVRSYLQAAHRGHSVKPAEARDRLVQLLGDVPRIELFARETTPGWDVWGNEVESTITLG